LSLLCLVNAGGAASASPVSAPAGHAVGPISPPRGFRPAAASFVSPAWGVVLGCSGSAYRAQLAVTGDGGAHWSLMRAPDVQVASTSLRLPQVNQVAFANPADGWLYDQYSSGHIWATHNGGASWRQVTLPGNVQAVEASANAVYAIAGSRLYSSPLGRDAWQRVSPGAAAAAMIGTALAVSGDSVWFGSSTSLWTSADGVHWAECPARSPGAYYGIPYELAGIAAASPRSAAFLWAAPGGMFHTGMKVLVSFNGGRGQWQTLASPPPAGDVAAFAVSPGRFAVISVAVVTPGLDNINRLVSLGQAWTTFSVPGTSGGAMLGSLEFMSPAVGCIVTGSPASGSRTQLLRTTDAGRTWHPVTF
jgi:hypothetical protein